MAYQNGEADRDPGHRDVVQSMFVREAASATRRASPDGDSWPEDSDAAELDIAFQFRRQMAGTGHLAREDRLHARRAIRAWRRAALKAVREVRAAACHAARTRRRLARPVPS